MDPITAAIAVGAAAGLRDDAAQAVREAYQAVKNLLGSRYPALDLTPVEEHPSSEANRESLSEDIVHAGADQDVELFEKARLLVDVIQRDDPRSASSIGVDLESIRADFLTIERVEGGVKARDIKTEGGISIADIRGARRPDPNF